jgi:hypothetical protein
MIEPINQKAGEFVKKKMAEHNQLMTPIEQFGLESMLVEFAKQENKPLTITELEKVKDMILNKNVGGVKGKTWGDSKYDSPSVAYGYNLALMDMHANISNLILENQK